MRSLTHSRVKYKHKTDPHTFMVSNRNEDIKSSSFYDENSNKNSQFSKMGWTSTWFWRKFDHFF